jgi:hypothetical protein
MVIWRNICIVLGLISSYGVYFGLSKGRVEVVTITIVCAVMCAFLGIYCHEEARDEDV